MSGARQVVAVPWAEEFGRSTRLFERLALQVLQRCWAAEACRLLRISWEEAEGIKQRAVDRGLARKPVRPLKRLCVDEKTAGWGQDYVTVVAHVTEERTIVEYGGDGREQASLDPFWTGLTSEPLAGVEAVAMDMWEPYFNSTCAHLPGAAGKIVYDPYHWVQHMNEAVNGVRKSEHRRLAAQGDAVLAGTRSLWLCGNVPYDPRRVVGSGTRTDIGETRRQPGKGLTGEPTEMNGRGESPPAPTPLRRGKPKANVSWVIRPGRESATGWTQDPEAV